MISELQGMYKEITQLEVPSQHLTRRTEENHRKSSLMMSFDLGTFLIQDRNNTSQLPAVQLGYLEVTVQEKLHSDRPGPFMKVEGCCD
jgi:hypothetical protein